MTQLKDTKAKVEAGGRVFISLKIALATQQELKEVFGMETTVTPWSTHPQYGQLYIMKEANAHE